MEEELDDELKVSQSQSYARLRGQARQPSRFLREAWRRTSGTFNEVVEELEATRTLRDEMNLALNEDWAAIKSALDLPDPKREPPGSYPVGTEVGYKGGNWYIDIVKKSLRICKESASVCAYRIVRREDGKLIHEIVPHEMVTGPDIESVAVILQRMYNLFASTLLGMTVQEILRIMYFGTVYPLVWPSGEELENEPPDVLSIVVPLYVVKLLALAVGPHLAVKLGYGRTLLLFSVFELIGVSLALVFRYHEDLGASSAFRSLFLVPAFLFEAEMSVRSAYLGRTTNKPTRMTGYTLLGGVFALGRLFGYLIGSNVISKDKPVGEGSVGVLVFCLLIQLVRCGLHFYMTEPQRRRRKILIPSSLICLLKFPPDQGIQSNNFLWWDQTHTMGCLAYSTAICATAFYLYRKEGESSQRLMLTSTTTIFLTCVLIVIVDRVFQNIKPMITYVSFFFVTIAYLILALVTTSDITSYDLDTDWSLRAAFHLSIIGMFGFVVIYSTKLSQVSPTFVEETVFGKLLLVPFAVPLVAVALWEQPFGWFHRAILVLFGIFVIWVFKIFYPTSFKVDTKHPEVIRAQAFTDQQKQLSAVP